MVTDPVCVNLIAFENAVQGRANLMAHIGQKFGLHARGLFSLVQSVFQSAGCFTLRAHIADMADKITVIGRRIDHHGERNRNKDPAAILGDVALVSDILLELACAQFLRVFDIAGNVFFAQQKRDAVADHLRTFVTD